MLIRNRREMPSIYSTQLLLFSHFIAFTICVCDATGFALPLVVHMSPIPPRERGGICEETAAEHINGQTLRGDLGGGTSFGGKERSGCWMG